MKALICPELSGPESLRVEEVEDPKANAGQVVVDVRAAGLNFPDVLMTQGKYQFPVAPPFSPGSEVSGVVSAVGDDVGSFSVGDEVVGLGLFGGLAEKVALPRDRVFPKPHGVSFEDAAVVSTTYGTCLYALADRAQLREGETVLVLGASGGVGCAAIEIAKALGARVIAAASSEEKLAFCREVGADETIDYAKEDLKVRAKALGGGGVDVVVDPVGGQFAEPALRAMGWGGRFLVVGFAGGDIPRIPLNLTLLKSCSIVGVFWGAFLAREPQRATEQFAQLGAWMVEGRIQPRITQRVPLAQGRDALIAMAERKVRGKIVVLP